MVSPLKYGLGNNHGQQPAGTLLNQVMQTGGPAPTPLFAANNNPRVAAMRTRLRCSAPPPSCRACGG